MGYSVGIGLTNNCNLNCAHCYRDTENISDLSLAQVQEICNSISVDSMGMGTGENALNPEFEAIVSYLSHKGIKLNIASNGYSLTVIPDTTLKMFNDVEVSIDFPTKLNRMLNAALEIGRWCTRRSNAATTMEWRFPFSRP